MIVKTNEVVGKNLYTKNTLKSYEYSSWYNISDFNQISSEYGSAKLKQGKKYTLSGQAGAKIFLNAKIWDKDKNYVFDSRFISVFVQRTPAYGFTTYEIAYIPIVIECLQDCFISICKGKEVSFDYTNVQLEEGTTATSYEPFMGYKSYLTADSNKLMEEMN